ncbi:unnamed protein product [Alopecurus aequalis]
MGCSSSKVRRGDVEMSSLPARAPERRHSLPARAVSALGSLSFCRGRHDSVHAYTTLPLDEQTLRGGADDRATASLSGKRGVMTVLESAALATSSTAQCPSEFRGEPSSPTPVQFAGPEFDPAILSLFRQTMAGPSPSHPELLFPEKEAAMAVEEPFARDIQEVTPEFHETNMVPEAEAEEEDVRDYVEDVVVVPSPAARARNAVVVVYFTSLRGVRKTFEDGRAVHAILGFYGVRVDERDVSMHADFKDELRGLLHGGLALPRVFVRQEQWRDLGGVDDVRALHDAGELVHALEDCEPLGPDIAPCPGCGNMRFVPCYTCYGSCRVFTGDEDDSLGGTFEECSDCNEKGLIRCPVCCY